MSRSSEVQMQDLLSAVTDALIRGEENVDHIIHRFGVEPHDVAEFITVVRDLHGAVQPVEPSAAFRRRLKAQLTETNTNQIQLVTRVRRMPARVHIAAIVAVAAGFLLILRRRFIDVTGGVSHEIEEAPAV